MDLVMELCKKLLGSHSLSCSKDRYRYNFSRIINTVLYFQPKYVLKRGLGPSVFTFSKIMDTLNSATNKTGDFKFKRTTLPKMIVEEKTSSKGGSEIIYEVDIHLKLSVSSDMLKDNQ